MHTSGRLNGINSMKDDQLNQASLKIHWFQRFHFITIKARELFIVQNEANIVCIGLILIH